MGTRARRSRQSGLADIALFEGQPADAVAILPPAIEADRARKNVTGAATKTIALAEAQSSLNQLPSAVRTIDEALKNLDRGRGSRARRAHPVARR